MVLDDIKVPPLLLFGVEGVWGFVVSLFVLWPAGLLAEIRGSLLNSMTMLWNTPSLQLFVVLHMLAILGYSLFAVLVTFSVSSMWHSILDNFRPLTDLMLFGATSGSFGESWNTYSWIELEGLIVLLHGRAIHNAPDTWSMSIPLRGQWFALGNQFGSIVLRDSRSTIVGHVFVPKYAPIPITITKESESHGRRQSDISTRCLGST